MVQTEIAEILNNMRDENQRNIENLERILAGVNTKLEAMVEDDEAVDTVRFYIAELKKVLEDKLSASMAKFGTFEVSVDTILSSQMQLAKTSELKDLFNVFSANNEALISELSNQKDLFNELNSRVSVIGENAVNNREELSGLIKNISSDLSVLGENIQKSVAQIDENVKAVNVAEQISDVNREIDGLREIIISMPNYSDEILKLNESLGSVVSQDDFVSFKENLSDFVQKIIDNSSLLNTDLAINTKKIMDSIENIDYSDLKDDFSEFRKCLDELKSVSYQASFDELSGMLLTLSENVNDLRISVSSDFHDNHSAVKANLDELVANLHVIKDDLTDYSNAIKETSDSNLSVVKNCIEGLQSNLDKLFDSFNVFKTDVVINRERLYEITENISKLEPVDYSYDIGQISSKVEDLASEYTLNKTIMSEKFEDIKNLLVTFDNSEAVKSQVETFERALSKVVTSEDFLCFKTELSDFIKKIIDNSNALYENSNSFRTESVDNFEKINSALSDLNINVQYLREISTHKPSEMFDNVCSHIEKTVQDLNSDNELNFGELKNSFEKVLSELSMIKEEFEQKNDASVFNISSGFDNLKMSLENILVAFNSIESPKESVVELDEKISRLNDVVSTFSSDLLLKQDEVVQHVLEGNDNNSTQIKYVSENIDGLKKYIDISVECIKNYMEEIEASAKSVKATEDEKLVQKLLDLETTLVQSANEYENKIELLQAKLSEFAHIVESSNSDTEGKIASSLDEIEVIKSELGVINEGLKSAKISNDEKLADLVSLLDAGVENIVFNITTLTDSITGNINSSLENSISGIDENFDKFFEIINELKSQHTLNNVDLIQDIELKVSALKDELELINSDIASALEAKSEEIVKAFEPIRSSFDEFIGSDFEKIIAEIKSQLELWFMNFTVDINSEFMNNSQALSRLEQSFKETYTKLSDIEECVNEKIQDDIELLKATFETVSREIRVDVEGRIEEQCSELKSYIDVALNNTKLENSLDELKKNFETSAKQIDFRLDELSSNSAFSDILLSLEGVDEKIDNLSTADENISNTIMALHAKVDALVASDSDMDILEEIDGIKDIIFEQRKFFEVSSDEKAAAIDKYLRDVLLKLENVDLEKNSDDIKQTILNALVSLVDQISFVEESEEIKDFVEEKTDEINQNLIEVKNQLKQLTSSDDDFDDTYSLKDVETDIARLRLAITNMSGNDFSDITDEMKRILESVEGLETSLTQEQIVDLKNDIEKLNEDILSISSRTNKLLLNSDESYKALSNGLDNFGEVINRLEERINYLDNDRLEQKLDTIHSMAVEAGNADKIFHQVMTYLGEWIDTATEKIDTISDRIVEVDNIKADIQELREVIPEKSYLLDSIEEKFELQEERIDRLEKGLDKVIRLLEQKDDTILEKKIDKIEKMLSSFGTNIEKLTSYVDEE